MQSGVDDPTKRLHALLSVGAAHTHAPWSQAGMTSSSRAMIPEAVARHANIKPCELQAGVGLVNRTTEQLAIVSDDPGWSNTSQVSRLLSKARKGAGLQAASSKLEDMYQSAQNELGSAAVYILTPVRLVRGPTPLIICATDTQLLWCCSVDRFLSMMMDFTFSEINELDCFDVHSMDHEVGMCLCLWRAYCNGKSADAHQYYFHRFEVECKQRGFDFVWGKSVVAIIVDFHYGANALRFKSSDCLCGRPSTRAFAPFNCYTRIRRGCSYVQATS